MNFTTIRNQLAYVVFILILMAFEAPAEPIIVSSSPAIGGTTSGGGTYLIGTRVVLTATPTNDCWTFSSWSDGSTNNPHTIRVSYFVTNYTAYFAVRSNMVITASSPADGGTTTGGITTNCGASVTLTATPNECFTFTNWSDGSTNNPYTITATSNTNYTANFVPVGNLTITTASSPADGGTTTGDTVTNCGSTVTLTATPTNDCWTFTGWSDGRTDNPHTVTVSSDTNFTATFVQKTFSIKTGVAPPNSGTATGDTVTNCGSTVTLTATPTNDCWTFTGWSDGSTDNPHNVTVTSDTNLTATFVQKNFTIQTKVAPPNGGTTTGDTVTNCGANVTVTATPTAGYQFVNWTIDKMVYDVFTHSYHVVQYVVSTLSQYTFTVGGNLTLTAHFLPPCKFTISPTMSAVIPVTGGGGKVTVSASAGCDWTYSSPYSFIHITNTANGVEFWSKPPPGQPLPAGPGPTYISYPVVPFTLQIAGQPFIVRQTMEDISHHPILTNMPEQ